MALLFLLGINFYICFNVMSKSYFTNNLFFEIILSIGLVIALIIINSIFTPLCSILFGFIQAIVVKFYNQDFVNRNYDNIKRLPLLLSDILFYIIFLQYVETSTNYGKYYGLDIPSIFLAIVLGILSTISYNNWRNNKI